MKKQGLFGLQTPEDMLAKAHRDYERMRASPMNHDAAFDFFVTARHIPEWLERAGRGTEAAVLKQHVQLRIARHIADRAKHFEVTAKHHRQVEGTTATAATWAPFAWNGWKPGAWSEHALVVALSPDDLETAELGTRIEVGRLAEETLRVLEQLVQEHPAPEAPVP